MDDTAECSDPKSYDFGYTHTRTSLSQLFRGGADKTAQAVKRNSRETLAQYSQKTLSEDLHRTVLKA
jgi:hypothetical protein